MIRSFINEVPSLFLLFILVLTLSCFATGIFFLTKKFLPSVTQKQSNQFLTLLITIISSNYAFLLGLVIINLWQNYAHTKSIVLMEANQLALMTLDSLALPSPLQDELLATINRYIHHVTYEEWPAMRLGIITPFSDSSLIKFFHTIGSYSPQTEMEKTFFHEFLTHMNGVLENRRLRWNSVENHLALPMIVILLTIIILISFLLSLFKSDNKNIHLFTVITATSILSFNVGIAILLSYPFSGQLSINPTPYTENILSRFSEK
ncbi:MAG: DUF4239 domain-containing protein [Alphaproteobacteria bacterium]|nr:DUF4239 domain-containing protein [Alphaproteobacteria bacterium]